MDGAGGNDANTKPMYEILKKLILKAWGTIQGKTDMQGRRAGGEGSWLQSDDPQTEGCQRLPVTVEAGLQQGSSLVPLE